MGSSEVGADTFSSVALRPSSRFQTFSVNQRLHRRVSDRVQPGAEPERTTQATQ